MRAWSTFIRSVPALTSEYAERTSTPPLRQIGAGTSSTRSSPVL
jgi:hypothetical protein